MATATKKKTPISPPVDPRKQRSDAVRNRKAVIAAARQEFARHGLECGMDEIAKAAGVGVGTVYRHFPTKQDLVDALIADHFQILAERWEAAYDQPDAWEAFCAQIRWTAELGASDQGLGEVLGHRPEVGQEAAVETGLVEKTTKLIRKAQRQGTMRKDARVEDVPTIVCGLGGATCAPRESFPGANWERLVEIILDGLRAQPGQNKLPPPRRTFT
jgi:AcrR family transcriptional regulator